MNNIPPITTSIIQCKCNRIRVYASPEMRTRQEMVPHIPKADLKFNEVWMNEHMGGGSYTFKKIVSRDPYKINK